MKRNVLSSDEASFSTSMWRLLALIALLLSFWGGSLVIAADSMPKIPMRLGMDSLHTGNLFLKEIDFELPSNMRLKFSLNRYYNSRSELEGLFGLGWAADPLDIHLYENVADQLILIGEEGREVTFNTQDGRYFSPHSMTESEVFQLTRLDDGSYVLLLKTGEKWEFNTKGYLISKTDSLGNSLLIKRSNDGITPEALISPLGHTVMFRIENGKIMETEGLRDLRVIYGYDKNGRLNKRKNLLGQESVYEYGTDGRLIGHYVEGGYIQKFSYTEGLLTGHSIEGVASYVFRYIKLPWGAGYQQETVNEVGRIIRKVEIREKGRKRIEMDDLGNQTILRFDEAGRLVGRKWPVGSEEIWDYTQDGILQGYTDIRGNRTLFEDDYGSHRVTMTDPRGGKTVFEYDLAGMLTEVTDPWGIVTQYIRDGYGRVVEVLYDEEPILTQRYDDNGYVKFFSSPEGSWTYERDVQGNIISMVDGEGRRTEMKADKLGRPVFIDAGKGKTLTLSYDDLGRPSSITDGEGNHQTFFLNKNGTLAAFKDGLGNTYRFEYKGEETSKLVFPDGTAESLRLDDVGRVMEETNHQGQKITYERDLLGRVIRQSFEDGFTTCQYDTFGQMIKTANAHSTYFIKYNRFGNVEEIKDHKGRSLRYEYNDKAQRTVMIDPEGRKTTYEYDHRGRLYRIVGPQDESDVYLLEYDLAGRLGRKTFPNGMVSEKVYDRGGLLNSISTVDRQGKCLYSMRLGRDSSGSIITLQDQDGTWNYTYDKAGRLVRVQGLPGYEEAFAYDGAGNRIRHQKERESRILRYGSLNELLSEGEQKYFYDRDGQPTGRSDGTSYGFNPLGQLLSVTTPGGIQVRYCYDPFGRLAAREVNGKRTDFFYDKEDIIAEYDESSLSPPIRYVHGPGMDEPLASWHKNDPYFYVLGLNDQVKLIVGNEDKPIDAYVFSPFGEIRSTSGHSGNSCLFNSRRWDSDAGLYYFRARFYDPKSGRFISPDPVRFWGGWNLYTYVNNDPVNWADPLGLRPLDILPKVITDLIPESIKKLTPDAAGITGSISAGKFVGFKMGVNYEYFGPNDPRNGFYLLGGLGMLSGKSLSVTGNMAKNLSDDPALPWEGLFLSPEGGARKVAGGGFVGFNPYQPTANGWAGVDLGYGPEKTLGSPPNDWEFGKGVGGGVTLTNYVHMRSLPDNEKMRVVRSQMIPPSASLEVGKSLVFRFEVTLETPPYGKGIKTPFNASNVAKWAYIHWDDPSHEWRTCNDPAVCNKYIFTCPKEGEFTIRANYYNPYTIDHSDSLSGAYASADITCGKESAKKGPKDKISFTKDLYVVREDGGPAAIMVRRMGQGQGRVSVQYETREIQSTRFDTSLRATKDVDYDHTSGLLVWEDKDMGPKVFHVFAVDDNVPEKDESLFLVLKEPDGPCELSSPYIAVLNIEDAKKPAVHLSKMVSSATVAPDDELKFTLVVTNKGNCPLSNVTVTDPMCSPMWFTGYDKNNNGLLDQGETWEYICSIKVPLTAKGNLTNVATVTASDPSGTLVSATDGATVTVTDRKVLVPYLYGLNREAAVYDIKEAELTVGRIDERKSDQPVGVVIAQTPEPNTKEAPGTAVDFTLSGDEPRRIFIDPPRKTIQMDEEITGITVTLITKDGEQEDIDPRTVVWGPPGLLRWVDGKGMTFTGREAGTFTVTAEVRGVSGWATYIVEEDWSVGWDKRISDPNDLDANVPLPVPSDYTWYALCDPDTGELTYGENPDPTRHKVLGGPFPGPTTAKFWIDNNCPRWRCNTDGTCATEPARGGKWAVLCDKESGSIVLGTEADPTRYWIMSEGFFGEPDARFWVDENCPRWRCTEDGACAKGAARGGKWYVLCDRDTGVVVLGTEPDPTKYFILDGPFQSESDARYSTQTNCPSWRCNKDGNCIVGEPYPEDKPGGLPPDLGSPSSAPGSVGYYLTKGTISLTINDTPCTVTLHSCTQCTDEDIVWLMGMTEVIKNSFANALFQPQISETSEEEGQQSCVRTGRVRDMKSEVVAGPSQTPFEVPKPTSDCPCKDTPIFQYQLMLEYDPECMDYKELQEVKPMLLEAIKEAQRER